MLLTLLIMMSLTYSHKYSLTHLLTHSLTNWSLSAPGAGMILSSILLTLSITHLVDHWKHSHSVPAPHYTWVIQAMNIANPISYAIFFCTAPFPSPSPYKVSTCWALPAHSDVSDKCLTHDCMTDARLPRSSTPPRDMLRYVRYAQLTRHQNYKNVFGIKVYRRILSESYIPKKHPKNVKSALIVFSGKLVIGIYIYSYFENLVRYA